MGDDLSPRACSIIGMMRRARKLDMPDLCTVEAVQSLAQMAADNEAHLSDEAMATIIAVGALLSVQADAEMKAGIAAVFAMKAIRS